MKKTNFKEVLNEVRLDSKKNFSDTGKALRGIVSKKINNTEYGELTPGGSKEEGKNSMYKS